MIYRNELRQQKQMPKTWIGVLGADWGFARGKRRRKRKKKWKGNRGKETEEKKMRKTEWKTEKLTKE